MGVLRSRSELRFFGLTLEYRIHLFKQIHEIVFFGKGGYDFDTIYNMPIWLRMFTFRNIQEYYEKENEASKASTPSMPSIPSVPSYKSKFRK